MSKETQNQWHYFHPRMGLSQKLPEKNKNILVAMCGHETGLIKVYTGSFSVSEQNIPYFHVPYVTDHPFAWCDCLPENLIDEKAFEAMRAKYFTDSLAQGLESRIARLKDDLREAESELKITDKRI